MITVAFYRARTVILRSGIVVLALVVLAAAGISSTVDHFRSDIHGGGQPGFIPISLLAGGAGFVGLIIASIVCANLCRERSTLALTWTRPQPRIAQALTLIGIDLVTILVVDLVAFAGILIVSTWLIQVAGSVGSTMSFVDTASIPRVVFAFAGASFMWYGVIAAVSAPFSLPLIAALSWPAFITIAVLAGTHGLRGIGLDPLMQALMLLDPLNYVHSITTHGNESPDAVIAASYAPLQSLISYLIAAAGIAVAAIGWSRKEYTR